MSGTKAVKWLPAVGYALAMLLTLVYINWQFTHAPNGQPTIIGLRVNGHTLFYHRWEYEGIRDQRHTGGEG